MPRPMTMTIEVEEIAFGRVFRTLDAMQGVVSINIMGSGANQPPAPPPSKRNYVPTMQEHGLRATGTITERILQTLHKVGSKTSLDLKQLMLNEGLHIGTHRSRIPTLLRRLELRGFVEYDNALKSYSVTDRGIKAYTDAQNSVTIQKHDKPLTQRVLSVLYANKKRTLTNAEMRSEFAKKGETLNVLQISSALVSLKKTGSVLHDVKTNRYGISAKGVKLHGEG